MEIKYNEEDLTEEEYKQALFEKDQTQVRLEMMENNLASFNKEMELRLPQRMLEQNLEKSKNQMTTEVETLKANLKVYEKQVRTKKKEVLAPAEEQPTAEEK